MTDQNTAAGNSFLSNVIAIIASIVVIAIVIWGLVHLASMSNSWFSSLFSFATSRSGSAIQITSPSAVVSDTPFNLTWKYSPSVPGTYALLYQCRTGLSLKTTGPDGRLVSIPCGAGYTVASTNQSAVVTPILTGSAATASLPVSVFFMPSSASSTNQQAHGETTLTVSSKAAYAAAHPAAPTPTPAAPTTPAKPAAVPAASGPTYATNLPQPVITDTETTPTPAKKPVVKHAAATYRGPADISVRILAVGVTDPATGAFVSRAPMQGETAAIQFDIKNVGGSRSGSYSFRVQLPTADHYIYASPAQRPLGAGDHVINILRFSNIDPNGGTASVNVATVGTDASFANNSAAQWVQGAGYNTYGTTYVPPQPYQPNPQYPVTGGYDPGIGYSPYSVGYNPQYSVGY